MKSIIKTISLLGILSLSIVACKDDDDTSVKPSGHDHDHHHHEQELITTLEVIVKDTMGLAIDTFAFRDQDGIGGNAPIVDEIILEESSIYDVELRFLDESDSNDIEDITIEIENEDDEHLVCYTSSSNDLSVIRTDSDGTYPVGIHSRWSTGGHGHVDLTITLKHQPGVKNGDCAPGETDVEVTFHVDIEH